MLVIAQHRCSALLAVLPAERSAARWVQRVAPLLLLRLCAPLKALLGGLLSAVAAQVQTLCADRLREHKGTLLSAVSLVSTGNDRIA